MDVDSLRNLLRDDGLLGDVLLRWNSVDVPLMLDLAGQAVSVTLVFEGVEEVSFIGDLSDGAVSSPELVGPGLNVFSCGSVELSAANVVLQLDWEGGRSFRVRAHGFAIRHEGDMCA